MIASRNFAGSRLIAASLAAAGMIYRNAESGEGSASTAKPTLTRAEKYANRIAVLVARIAKDNAELADVRQEAETAERLSSVSTGTVITARLGRAGSAEVQAAPAVYAEDGVTILTPAVEYKAATAGTLRFVEAVVLGVKEEANGSLRYKIQFGSGFDQDVEIIQASQITEVKAVAEAEQTTPESGNTLYQANGVNY